MQHAAVPGRYVHVWPLISRAKGGVHKPREGGERGLLSQRREGMTCSELGQLTVLPKPW